MNVKEFNKRIDQSMKDSSEGKLTDGDDLIADIDKWS